MTALLISLGLMIGLVAVVAMVVMQIYNRLVPVSYTHLTLPTKA